MPSSGESFNHLLVRRKTIEQRIEAELKEWADVCFELEAATGTPVKPDIMIEYIVEDIDRDLQRRIMVHKYKPHITLGAVLLIGETREITDFPAFPEEPPQRPQAFPDDDFPF